MISYIGYFFMLLGAALCLISTIGLIKYSDFMKKLHAASKASSLGVIFFIFGLMLVKYQTDYTIKGMLIILFVFFTTPISSYIMAKAKLRK